MQAEMVTRQLTITADMVTAARKLVLATHPDARSLAVALKRASPRLLTQAWVFDVEEKVLQIASYSHPTDVHFVSKDECDCETWRGVCWHIAGCLMVSVIAAARVIPVAPIPLPIHYERLENDDYPGDFLSSLADEDTFGGVVKGWDSYGDVLTANAFFEEVDELPAPAPRVLATFTEPFRPRSREHIPEPGSEFAKAQELADRMFGHAA